MHPIKEIIEARKEGNNVGIYSICSASKFVIEAGMLRALKENQYVLIEATANQVNQFGGYTGMKPRQFRDFVEGIANDIGFPLERIILGGDHLGPLTWQDKQSCEAMELAKDLIKEYVEAGFTKIHIDTSMRLADDSTTEALAVEVIAKRGAILCKEAEGVVGDIAPVYVIGSEVPIPGGAQEEEETLLVTTVDDFNNTVNVFKKEFESAGVISAWDRVVAVVVQPGVEFGDCTVHEYNREAAKELCLELQKNPNIVLEGHSTDYQTKVALREMVEDGIAILKVGPALTFMLREALICLDSIEKELYSLSKDKLSNFREVLEGEMIANSKYWKSYYHGTEQEIENARLFSYSDRCRYYLSYESIEKAIDKMMSNLEQVEIPLNLLSQFMPIQYEKIRNGEIENSPKSLILDRIDNIMENYIFAVKG